MKPVSLPDRARFTQATVDKFYGQDFAWGSVDCARIAAFHVHQFGWKPSVAKFGTYRTEAGALAALKRHGMRTTADLVDAVGLPPLAAPAFAWVGDLIALESDTPLGGLNVYLGNGKVLGFHQDAPGACVLTPRQFLRAWRV